ncbi:hypothetical protein CCM_04959 [Cordyceps militaris CM01]|uniref:Uncharacterized protein n=1 Tax=Cordyceps militaris (strain CM01) TaxID=983644 RepID=G3JFL0_CORMM|nr:uncharacterized protein CCM_04959 [Cordyceps militaris CM01]EGX93584.1 hypothetical protein CCM_04959 [Cordyceps militaris CM01]
MRPTIAVGLILASWSSVAAADDSNVRGIIYTEENGGGTSFKIRSSNCIRLRSPLTGNVRSLDVTLFQECTLYYERRCDSDVKHVEFLDDQEKIQDPAVEAIRCTNVDADCVGGRGQEL